MMVMNKLRDMNLDYEKRDISDDAVLQDLLDEGGKQQVPYLIDSDNGVAMYESGDIIEHLEKHFA